MDFMVDFGVRRSGCGSGVELDISSDFIDCI